MTARLPLPDWIAAALADIGTEGIDYTVSYVGVECDDCDNGEAGYEEHPTRDNIYYPVGQCETCGGRER